MEQTKAPRCNYMALPEINKDWKRRVLTKREFDNAISIVSNSYGVTKENIMSDSRLAKYVRPRHMLSYLLRKTFYRACFSEIGRYLNRGHATILVSCQKIEGEIEMYKEVREEYKHLEQLI